MRPSGYMRFARISLLLTGTVFAALILFIGCASLVFYSRLAGWEYIYNSPLLAAQVAFLFVVSGTSLLGIVASAFSARRLRDSRLLRLTLVAPALLFSLNDLIPVLAGGELNWPLAPSVAISAGIGAVISLAIASAWLPAFQKVSGNDHD
jgi:hypothetical protein